MVSHTVYSHIWPFWPSSLSLGHFLPHIHSLIIGPHFPLLDLACLFHLNGQCLLVLAHNFDPQPSSLTHWRSRTQSRTRQSFGMNRWDTGGKTVIKLGWISLYRKQTQAKSFRFNFNLHGFPHCARPHLTFLAFQFVCWSVSSSCSLIIYSHFPRMFVSP